MDFCTLASGSRGNCALLCCGTTYLLLDAGISARRITTSLKSLGIDPANLSGVLVTHEHTDHVSGLATLTKQLGVPVYATAPTLNALYARVPALQSFGTPVKPGASFSLGEVDITSFPTSHDAACSVGYTVSGDGCKVALATDLGYLSKPVFEAVHGCDLLVCESNHDEDWVRSGPYPYGLQQRVLGKQGHLSNEAGAELAAFAVEHGARTVLLAHLSSENNTPARARGVAAQRLAYGGVDPERDITLMVAPKQECGPLYHLERGRDTRAHQRKQEAVVC